MSILPADIESKAGDHDFHMVSLTPSVTLLVDFDGDINEQDTELSFYRGTAHVCLKDSIFQPSHTERHAVELVQLLRGLPQPTPILFVVTDGGPDHNCRHISVQLSWLAVMLATGMDMLVVSRVAPTQSWQNPAERVMGPLNLALQNMALCRQRMDDAFEKIMARCNGMATVRAAATQMQEAQQIGASTLTTSTLAATDITGEAQQPTGNTPTANTPIANTPTPTASIPIAAPPSASPLTELRPFDEGDEEAVQLLQAMSRTIELDLAGTDDDTSIEEIGDGDDDWELLDDEEASDRDESPTAPRDITPPGPEQPTMLVDFLSTYRASVQPVMLALESQMRRATWNGMPIQVHQPADDAQVIIGSNR